MAVTIKNKPNNKDHQIYEYFGFVDSEGNFFLITKSNTIVLMDGSFPDYNLTNGYNSIEEFLEIEFNTILIHAYKQNDFDITIDLK